MNKTPQNKPEIGMGATGGFGSDCYPYTVIKIVSPKKIIVQQDSAVMNKKGEYFGDQIWDISRDPEGSTMVVTLRKNGNWVSPGCDMWSTGNVVLGHRCRREDPHF